MDKRSHLAKTISKNEDCNSITSSYHLNCPSLRQIKKVPPDSRSSWFSIATFVNEKHWQDSGVSASFTITLIKCSGNVANNPAANSSQAPFKGEDTPFHYLWRYPWYNSSQEAVLRALPTIRATPPDESEMLHGWSTLPLDELSILLGLFAHVPRGRGDGEKSFHGIQLFSHGIFCDCLALDFMAMNLNRWNSDKEIIQHRN